MEINSTIRLYSYSKRLLFEYIRCLPQDSYSVIHIEIDGIYFDTRGKETFENNLNNYDGEFVSITKNQRKKGEMPIF